MKNIVKDHKYKGGVDVAKFCMAICVIAIHTHPFEEVTNQTILNIYSSIVSMAVPFFFISSGFFMFREDKEIETQITKSLKRYIKLYATWTCIYLPITIWGYIISNHSVIKSMLLFIRGVFFVGQNQNSWMLWYLLSSIFALLTIYLLVVKFEKSVVTVWYISIVVFCIHLLVLFIYEINNVNNIVNLMIKALSFVMPSSRILTGLFYITTGVLIAKYKIFEQKSYWLYPVLLTATVLLNTLLEFNVFSQILTLFSSLFLFLTMLNIQITTNKLTIMLRQSSTVMYFTHMIFFTLYSQITSNVFELYGINSFLVVLIACLLLSSLVMILKNMKINRFIFN